MKDILSAANREVLQQFAWSNLLLAFDYDGTLAPIVRDPGKAAMRATTRRLLAQAAARYPCTVITGRSRADVRRWLQDVPMQGIIGNHGIEPWQTGQPLVEAVKRCVPILDRCLSFLPGVRIENKAFSISVHYRRSREKKKARAAILAAATRLGPVRVIAGKQVVNILPEGAHHKGMALESERDRLGCDTAIYVGDDETDEDVFALDQPGRLLTVRVIPKRSSQATYYVKNQAAVDELLALLVDLRREPALGRAAHS
jgi:trehalose 6-phosphate phosphatase